MGRHLVSMRHISLINRDREVTILNKRSIFLKAGIKV